MWPLLIVEGEPPIDHPLRLDAVNEFVQLDRLVRWSRKTGQVAKVYSSTERRSQDEEEASEVHGGFQVEGGA